MGIQINAYSEVNIPQKPTATEQCCNYDSVDIVQPNFESVKGQFDIMIVHDDQTSL